MGRQDFVTDPENTKLGRYDGTEVADRIDLARYITRYGRPYPNPSGMILIADPTFISDDVLEALLAPNDDGMHPVILTDSDFTWSPPAWMHDLELRAQTWSEMGQGREWCAACHAPVTFQGLDFFWKGRPVCNECPSEEWKAVQRQGYECANSVEAEYDGEDVTLGMDEWMKALVGYAAEIKANGGPKWLGAVEGRVPTPVQGEGRDED
jgi:hypothetical protein